MNSGRKAARSRTAKKAARLLLHLQFFEHFRFRFPVAILSSTCYYGISVSGTSFYGLYISGISVSGMTVSGSGISVLSVCVCIDMSQSCTCTSIVVTLYYWYAQRTNAKQWSICSVDEFMWIRGMLSSAVHFRDVVCIRPLFILKGFLKNGLYTTKLQHRRRDFSEMKNK